MRIGQIAERSGVPTKTIRYYESVGLLPRPDRTASGYRDYDEPALQRLRFVQRARSLGFSVRECANLLALYEDKKRASAEVKGLAREHVAQIDAKMAELRSMRCTLGELIDKCHGDERPDCPILDDLAEGSGRR
jgi:MerR family copper efflux transcriptional regulator